MARPRSFHIQLTSKERRIIKQFQKKTTSTNSRTRCAILLAADPKGQREKSYAEIANATGSCVTTVVNTLQEFTRSGFLETVTPARNPNSDTARLKVTGDIEAKIIATACSPAPKGYVKFYVM